MGHVLRHVPRPSFGGVEANDANRVVTLAVQQIRNDGFEVGMLYVGLGPGTPVAAEIVEHKIDVLITAGRNDRGGTDALLKTPTSHFKHGPALGLLGQS
jgi:hypothetical protein